MNGDGVGGWWQSAGIGNFSQSASGIPPGPMVGQVMREVEDWWIDADFTDDQFSLMERLKAVVTGLA